MTMRISHLFAFLFLFISTTSFCQITDTIHLQEVVLNQKTKFKKVKTGRAEGSYSHLIPTEFGCCYKNDNLKGKLETIELFFKKSIDTKEKIKNKLRLRFYSLDENGIPNKELTSKPLIFTVNNVKENIKLDLSEQNIYTDGYIAVTLEKLTNKGNFDFSILIKHPKKNEGYFLINNVKWEKFNSGNINYYFKMEFELSNTTQNL